MSMIITAWKWYWAVRVCVLRSFHCSPPASTQIGHTTSQYSKNDYLCPLPQYLSFSLVNELILSLLKYFCLQLISISPNTITKVTSYCNPYIIHLVLDDRMAFWITHHQLLMIKIKDIKQSGKMYGVHACVNI